LRPGRNKTATKDPVAWGTVRGLRSAANQYYSWLYQSTDPKTSVLDDQQRVLRTTGQVPNATLGHSLLTQGMCARRGNAPVPSVELHVQQIAWMDTYLDQLFGVSHTPEPKRLYARAGLALTGAWLSWLRSGELFGMDWDGNTVIEPEDGPQHGLPSGVGAILWKLLEQTKSNRTSRADVPMAYTTGSGFSLGKWMHRLREALGVGTFPDTATPIFVMRMVLGGPPNISGPPFSSPCWICSAAWGILIFKHMMDPPATP
jgi:hypothetical protein